MTTPVQYGVCGIDSRVRHIAPHPLSYMQSAMSICGRYSIRPSSRYTDRLPVCKACAKAAS
jgi:hypothetical protein